jgi:hypothetical protein
MSCAGILADLVYTDKDFRARLFRYRRLGKKRRKNMQNIIKVMVGLAAIGFILAVVGAFTQWHFMGIAPESYSRGCTNLALLSIAASLVFKE